MSALLPAVLQIDVVSDVVCPWCYIGKRQLEIALARWQARNPALPAPTLRWRPFQLNPEIPAAGIPRGDYLLRKFGVPDGGKRYDRVVAAAEAELRDYRVTGVPLFIIGNAAGEHLAVNGAQGADALLEAMLQVQAA